MSGGYRQHSQGDAVHFFSGNRPKAHIRVVVGAGRIGDESHFVAMEHGIAGRGVAAVLSGHAGDHNRIDLAGTQDDVQVCAKERAVPMLLDDDLVPLWSHFGVDINASGLIDQSHLVLNRRVNLPEQPHIAAVAAVGVGGEDHFHAGLAGMAQQFLQAGHQLHAHGRFQRGAGGDEVVLHVDHNDCRAARIDLINLNSHFILLWFVQGRTAV